MADPLPAVPITEFLSLRRWLFFGGVIVAWAIFNVALNPAARNQSAEPSTTQVLLIGAAFSQPLLLGLWAALGPRPAAARLLLSILALEIVVLARPLWEWSHQLPALQPRHFEAQTAISMAMSFIAGFLIGAMLGWLTRWQLDKPSDSEASVELHRQYSLKYLLVLMTLIAVVLAIVRGIGWTVELDLAEFWQNIRQAWLFECGIFVLLLFPIAFIAMIAQSPRPTLALLLVAAIGLIASTGIGLAIVYSMIGSVEPNVTIRVLQIQLGAAVFCFANAAAIRAAGYRLTRRPIVTRSASATNSLH